jgi:hypothetical protein
MRFLLNLFAICMPIVAFAQDIIVLKTGDIIQTKVIEIGQDDIKYKKSSNLNGPIYSESKSSVLSIRYENGEVDKFNQEPTSQSANTNGNASEPIKAQPSDDNQENKAKYEIIPRFNTKSSDKAAKNFFPIMAFTDSSVISTNELSIIMDPTAVMFFDGGWKVKLGYSILLVNKTNKPIYIDRANCFRRFNDLTTQSYYDNKQTTVSHGDTSSSGIGIGIGSGIGIGIGGSSSSSYAENHNVERFLAIGPKSKANLQDYEYVRLSENKAKFKLISDIEYWGFNLYKKSNTPIKEGEIKEYSESDSPYSNCYFITYSTDPEFKNAYTIEFELYAKYIVGAKIKQDKWAMSLPNGDSGQNSVATSIMVSEIQKTIPDFWSDSPIIIGTCGGRYY